MKKTIMELAYMEALTKIDAASPEAIILAKQGAQHEAIQLVAAQLSQTRQVETRDLIESSEMRFGTRVWNSKTRQYEDAEYTKPGPCTIVTTKVIQPSTLSYKERFANLMEQLS